MDPLHLLSRLPLPFLARCRIPRDLAEVTDVADEATVRGLSVKRSDLERVWRATESLYRTGVYPALQICILRRGEVALHRSLGHARGNAPSDPVDGPMEVCTTETPFNIFSASKAVTAMVIHKLDEQRVLHLEDRVCDFIPEFARHGKERITLRHLLAHRAGIPNLPPDSLDLDLLDRPAQITEMLCDARPRTRPGRMLAYHAVTGGFVLGEVVQRATGSDIRTVLEREICEPLGFRWMSYGVAPEDVERVAVNANTGPPAPPPVAGVLQRALGLPFREVVELANDSRFLTGIIPSGNVVTTAEELAVFYQCLLDGGERSGVRVFEDRTVRHATSEQSYWELDLTLGLPLRYGLGFMLGDKGPNLFGWGNPHAFGHVGFTNMFSWADPERELVVVLLTSGKPLVSVHAIRLVQFVAEVQRAFPEIRRADSGRGAQRAASSGRGRIGRAAAGGRSLAGRRAGR